MKKILFVVGFNFICFGMEQESPVDLQLRTAYQYIDDHNLYKDCKRAQYALLEAIVKKDITQMDNVIAAVDEQARPYVLNGFVEILHFHYEKEKKQEKYPALYAFYKDNSKKFEESSILPLAIAVVTDDLSVVQALFSYRIPLAIYLGRYDSPFNMAVKCGPKCIKFLIEQEPSQNALNEGLFSAIIADNLESVKILLKAGASLENKKTLGLTPLHVACNNGRYEIVKFFLENGAFVDVTDLDGLTPLHWCSLNMKGHIADLLLDHGANVLAKTHEGDTVIECISMSFGRADAMCLLKQGAPYPETPSHQEMLGDFEHELFCSTPFYCDYFRSLIKGDSRKALTAIAHAKGNELNEATMVMNKLTALHWAVIRGNEAVVRALVTPRNKKLKTFLSKIPVVSWYSQHLVNINCRDEKGRTPLMWAARLGYIQIYQDLIRAGAKSSLKDCKGKIALNYVADYRNIEMLRTMIIDGTISAKQS